jgi:hypothetical protein
LKLRIEKMKMMVNKKYSDVLFALIMGFLMVLIITFANAVIRVGFTKVFLINWIINFSIGYSIAVPLIFILPKRIRRFISNITY